MNNQFISIPYNMPGLAQKNQNLEQDIQNLESIIEQLKSEIRKVESYLSSHTLSRVTINFIQIIKLRAELKLQNL